MSDAQSKAPVDIGEARKRRAEILEPYNESSFDGFLERFEAGWRAIWADECKRKGKTIPFDEWFFTEDENGDSPFEVAGMWPWHRGTGAVPTP
jgi:hypothetical protein